MINVAKQKIEFELLSYGKVPNHRQIEWYRREKSIFFHFGINTYTNREWGDGTDDPKIFNPVNLDCRQWIKVIKDAGFTTAILTAKHHDGFCLWPSKYTEYSVKNSPYKDGKGDIVKEFTDACSEFGIKAGLYLSPWDRHEPTWGTDEYNDFYVNQIEEIFNNYGKIWECWWDGAGSTIAKYDYERWGKTVRKCQPDAVIFGSLGATPYVDVRWVGNENGVAGKPCWATVEEIALLEEINEKLNSGKADGDRFIPAEVDVSIRPGWFYHQEQDNQVRSPENLLKLWFSSVGSNAGLLLNIPPNRDGLLHESDIKSLKRFNEMLTEGFKSNIAEKAEISANSFLDEKYTVRNILNKNFDDVYTSGTDCLMPEIVFEFESEIEFNTFVLDEAIEYGHKIRGFELSALVDDDWIIVWQGECVGYRCAEHFDNIKTKKLRLKITNAVDSPIIRFFGIYNVNNDWFKVENARFSNENIMRNGLAFVERDGDCFDVNLGGVIPFNKIFFEGDKIENYELYIFDGSKYILYSSKDNVNQERIECAFSETIDWAYKFRINVLKKKKEIEHLKIEVYFN